MHDKNKQIEVPLSGMLQQKPHEKADAVALVSSN